MERKIGEVFEYQGKKLQVKAGSNDNSCGGCIFNGSCTRGDKSITGFCEKGYRDDKKDVIFVEVQEQKAEEPKERKVGETFVYQGKKLKVVQTTSNICNNCYFECRDCDCENIRKVLGACVRGTRSDNKPVIFVEVTDEQPQEQAEPQEEPQKLDLCEILKYCPQGEPFWSPMWGDVKFYGIDHTNKRACVTAVNNVTWGINADGTITIDDITSEEVMLYPSREQRDWTRLSTRRRKSCQGHGRSSARIIHVEKEKAI